MGDHFWGTLAAFFGAAFTVALVAVLVKSGSQTGTIITNATTGLSSVINAAEGNSTTGNSVASNLFM